MREDLQKYEDVEFKAIPGHNPELVFLDAEGKEMDVSDVFCKRLSEC